jgi:hypothetical protein
MGNIHYVYLTTNIVNGKQYVGAHTTNNIDDGYLGSGNLIRRSIKKYGKESFKKEILQKCETLHEARKLEEPNIIKYKTLIPIGYNIHPNGGNGEIPGRRTKASIDKFRESFSKVPRTAEWKTNISKGLSGRKFTNEHCQNISKSHIGQNCWCKGKTGIFSKETIEKMSKRASERVGEENPMFQKTVFEIWEEKFGKEEADKKLSLMKDKMSKTRVGKKASETTCKNISKGRMGQIYDKKECPHCHKMMDPGNYNRWHGDKCKENI